MRFYQLKIGHGVVGTFLARIKAMETPECWWCGAQEQTVIHLYMNVEDGGESEEN